MKTKSFIFFFLLISSITYAIETHIHDSQKERAWLPLEKTAFYVDSGQNLSINDILSNRLTPTNNPGYNQSREYTYWIRFKLKISKPGNNKWYLEFVDPHISQLTIYEIFKDVYKKIKAHKNNLSGWKQKLQQVKTMLT